MPFTQITLQAYNARDRICLCCICGSYFEPPATIVREVDSEKVTYLLHVFLTTNINS
jgi:hypothetical protein